MPTFRLAKSLVALRDAMNARAPLRSRASDGWIGDASHASRSSDHNPWVKDGNMGVVTALDITHDPAHGVDGDVLAKAVIKDPRVKYAIWNKKIWTATKAAQGWRKYTGKNPHTKHVHVSASSKKDVYDDEAPWPLEPVPPPAPLEPVPPELIEEVPATRQRDVLRIKAQGGDVFELQSRLGVKVDGDFGPKTQAAVKAFQKAQGLAVDGVVGPYTWEALDKKTSYAPPVAPPGAIAAPRPVPEAPAPGPVPQPPPAEVHPYGSPKWAVQYFRKLGWSREIAIALVAHLMWESGGHRQNEIKWNAHGDKGTDGQFHSHGAPQLNDKHGRWQGYEKFSKWRGTTWDDPESQLLWMDGELGSTEKAVAKKLRNARTVPDATKAGLEYWRPGVPHTNQRMAIAERLAKEIPT